MSSLALFTRKIAFSAALVTMMVGTAHAGSASLESLMSGMGKSVRTLQSALIKHDPIPAEQVQKAAHDLVDLTTQAAQVLPTQLVDETGKTRTGMEAAAAHYADLMNQLMVSVTKLEIAVTAGDSATASTILLNEVLTLRQQGHEVFKE